MAEQEADAGRARGIVTGVEPAFEGTPLASIDWGTKLDLSDGVLTVAFLESGLEIGRLDQRGRLDPTEPPWTTVAFTADERASLLAALEVYETFLPIEVVVVDDPAAATFRLFKTDPLEIAEAFMVPPAFPPNADIAGLSGYDAGLFEGPIGPGSLAFSVALHELGHGFGLDHPHESFGQSDIMTGVTGPDDAGAFRLNQGVHVIMSYNDGWPEGPLGPPDTAAYGYPMTPMALDVAALQEKYGANETHAAGDDVYRLPRENGPGTGYAAIWDTGGRDAIRHAGPEPARIALTAATLEYAPGGGGVVSFVDGIRGGFTIAHGVTIENAVGGGGDDVLRGNAADNVLRGRGGADTLEAGDGADRLLGGKGADALYGEVGADILSGGGAADLLVGGPGADVARGGSDDDTLYGATGPDRLFGGSGDDSVWAGGGRDEVRGNGGDDGIDGSIGADDLAGGAGADSLFGDRGADTLAGNGGPDRLLGDEGPDLLRGGRGEDVLEGFAGRDRLFGGPGADALSGGRGPDRLDGKAGPDTLEGGPGGDVLSMRPGGGADLVRDFVPGEDLLDVAGFGFADGAAALATGRQTADGAVLSLGPDATLTLAGLAL